jgi:hypothetical protein
MNSILRPRLVGFAAVSVLTAAGVFNQSTKDRLFCLDADPVNAAHARALKGMSTVVVEAFPAVLHNLSLAAVGVRRVTWLQFHTYAMGVYLSTADGSDLSLLRLVPTRSTNGKHLRNAFTRSLDARCEEKVLADPSKREQHLETVKEFCSWFPQTITEGVPLDIHCNMSADQQKCSIKMTCKGVLLGEIVNDSSAARWIVTELLKFYALPYVEWPMADDSPAEMISGMREQVSAFLHQ